MKKAFFFLIALLAVMWAAAGCAETSTVMVYMCGSNLESIYGSATKDIQEILSSGMDCTQTRVYLMTGGSARWQYASISAEYTNIYTLTPKVHGDGIRLEKLESYDGMNMGDPETLSRFLAYCKENSSTDCYALIFWDHGGGPVNGVCWDEKCASDHLSMEEITAALSASSFGQEKLDWIGFDACLMSSVEVASMLSPYANYMIASQAEEPASGWNYSFLKDMENDAGAAETGRRIIDAYFDVRQQGLPDLTMSCVDLSAVHGIEDAMDTMYAEMASYLTEETFSVLSKLRFSAAGYGKSVIETKGASGYDLVDVVSLTESYASQDPDNSERVKAAVGNAVVYSRSNVDGSSGLSVYHPYRNQERFTREWKNTYAQLNFCPGYTSYVQSYGRIMTGEQLVKWNDLEGIGVLEEKNGETVVLHISEDQAANLASARLIVLGRNLFDMIDEAYYQVYSTADVSVSGTLLSAVYHGTCMTVMNETGYSSLTSGSISYRVTEDGTFLVNLYPIDENLERPEKPIIAEYIQDRSGQLLLKGYAVYDEMTETYMHRVDVDLSQYIGITFQNDYRVPTMNAAGEYMAFDNWAQDEHTNMQWRSRRDIDRTNFLLSMSYEMDFAEMLFAAYEITDTQGNVYMTELVPLNSGVATYACESSVWTMPPQLAGELYVLKQSGYTVLLVGVYNINDGAQAYMIENIKINGVPVSDGIYALVDDQYNYILLNQHNEDVIQIPFEQAMLAELLSGEPIRQITGNMTVYAVDEEGYTEFSIPLTIEPEQPVSVVFPKTASMESMEKYECTIRRGDHLLKVVPDLSAKIVDSETTDQMQLLMILNNVSNEKQFCFIRDVSVNGVSIPDAIGVPVGAGENDTFAPGDWGGVRISLTKNALKDILGGEPIRKITGVLCIGSSEAQNSYSYSLQFAVEPDAPVPLSLSSDPGKEKETLYYDCSLKLPALGDAEIEISSFVIQKPSDFADNSKLIVNFTMTNTSDSDIHYALMNTKANGVPVAAEALNYQGSGAKDMLERNSIAPGEQSGASIVLKYEDIAAIIPAVSLRDMSFDLSIYRIQDGNDQIQQVIPVQMVCNVPLNDFYQNTVELPDQFLIDYGKDYGAFDEESAKELFTLDGCGVSLQGVYVVERSFVLFLRCDNQSDIARNIYLGQAEVDGLPATIGRWAASYLVSRNNRVKTFGLNMPEWPEKSGVEVNLAPGETQYCYVSILPDAEDQTECFQISFQAYMNSSDNAWDCAYFDKITLSTEEPAPLQAGFCAVAPAEEYLITGGQVIPSTDNVPLVSGTVETAGAANRQPVRMEVTVPEEETLEICHYALFRKVRSEAELAGLNVLNSVDQDTGSAAVSFAQDREWLVFEFFGEMEISGNGHTASAVYPGLRAMVYAGDESFPLRNTRIETNEDGKIVFRHANDGFHFYTTDFPDAILGYGIKTIEMIFDPNTEAGKVTALNESVNANGYENKYSSLAGLATQRVHLLPGDLEPQEIALYLYNERPTYKLNLLQYMYGKPLQLAVEPVTDMEDYCVTFFYVTTDGNLNATPLQLLSDFSAEAK